MATITLLLAIIANITAIYTLLWCMSTSTEMLNLESDLRDCATRTRTNKLKLDTLDNQVNKPKGVFCVPSVGSQVWVFHYRGDLNFPVYIGGRHDFRGNSLITDSDSPQGYPPDQGPKEVEEVQSLDYPGVFENLFGGN